MTDLRLVLNVGGNHRDIELPAAFDGWQQHLLDIDPSGKPDILADARELKELEPGTYDAIYCSHNLEHYYHHEVPVVLEGFQHVLKPDGFADIRVPDIPGVMAEAIKRGLDIEDELYESPVGSITVRDVLYGHGGIIARSGEDFFAHKTGFSRESLLRLLKKSGFAHVFGGTANLEIRALAFRKQPDAWQRGLYGLPQSG